jgi:hypothetical protein
VRVARGAGLRELFSPEQLGALLGLEHPLAWATAEISPDRSATLFQYLVGYRPRYSYGAAKELPPLVSGMELDGAAVVRRLTRAFLAAQTDDWVTSLYGWLQRALLTDLRQRELIRCEDGSHAAAFDGNGHPQVWLPPENETAFRTVKRAIAADEIAYAFLRELGLTEPDLVDEVITSVVRLHSRCARPRESSASV